LSSSGNPPANAAIRPRWRWLLWIYLVLLGASDLVRWTHPYRPGLRSGEAAVTVHAMAGDRALPDSVRLA
jgi:hypothetical protein